MEQPRQQEEGREREGGEVEKEENRGEAAAEEKQ